MRHSLTNERCSFRLKSRLPTAGRCEENQEFLRSRVGYSVFTVTNFSSLIAEFHVHRSNLSLFTFGLASFGIGEIAFLHPLLFSASQYALNIFLRIAFVQSILITLITIILAFLIWILF